MSATGLSAEDSTRFFGRAWGASSCGATVGWFGGKITRRAQERTRDKYDYRVMLNEDEGTHSMKLLIEEYDVDENAGVGAWVLLEPIALPAAQDQHVGVRRSGRTLTPNVRNIDQS